MTFTHVRTSNGYWQKEKRTSNGRLFQKQHITTQNWLKLTPYITNQ